MRLARVLIVSKHCMKSMGWGESGGRAAVEKEEPAGGQAVGEVK